MDKYPQVEVESDSAPVCTGTVCGWTRDVQPLKPKRPHYTTFSLHDRAPLRLPIFRFTYKTGPRSLTPPSPQQERPTTPLSSVWSPSSSPALRLWRSQSARSDSPWCIFSVAPLPREVDAEISSSFVPRRNPRRLPSPGSCPSLPNASGGGQTLKTSSPDPYAALPILTAVSDSYPPLLVSGTRNPHTALRGSNPSHHLSSVVSVACVPNLLSRPQLHAFQTT